MLIRKMKSSDLPALAKMNAQIFGDTSSARALMVFQLSFKSRVNGGCLVAEEDGKPIGAIFGEKITTFYPHAATIRSFFVAKGQRGKGVGKALFSLCMAGMKKSGITNVSLHVDAKNKKALSVYKKAGFKPFRLLLLRRF